MARQATQGNTIVYQLGLIAVLKQPAKKGRDIYSVYQVDKNGNPIKFYNSHTDQDRAEKETLVIVSDIAVNNTVGKGIDPKSVPALLQAAKNALADLAGIMPEFEPSGERTHPAWTTINELEAAIKSAKLK